MNSAHAAQRGFTILEMLMAMAIFLIICAAMFELLDLSQKKYSSETQLTAAYQDARLSVDQILRDFNVSGYPPADLFSVPPSSSRYATYRWPGVQIIIRRYPARSAPVAVALAQHPVITTSSWRPV